MSEHTTGGAGRAFHPKAAARAVCDWCGAFMCDACTEGGQKRLCSTCRARSGAAAFPLRRDAWRLDALFGIAWRAFTRGGLQIVVALLVLVGTYVALSYVPLLIRPFVARNPAVFLGGLIAWTGVDMVIVTGLWLGLMDMTFDALDGQPVRLGTLFWHLGKTGRLLLLLLVILGATLLPTLAFQELASLAVSIGTHLGTHARIALVGLAGGGLVALAGSIWLLLALTFALLELALDDDVGAIEAMRRSFVLARGKRWAILGVGLLAGLVGMAGMLLCGIGMLASLPLAYLVMSALFLTLRNGSGLPDPVRRGKRVRSGVTPSPVPPTTQGF